MVKYHSAFINGKFVQGIRKVFLHPWSKEEIPLSIAPNQVDLAVEAAFEQKDWAKWNYSDRSSMLLKLSKMCLSNEDELSRLETFGGKPIGQAREDVRAVAQVFEYFGEQCWPEKTYYDSNTGNVMKKPRESLATYTQRQARGVVGLIIPFNYPLLLTAWKVAPALLAGNTIVLKPSSSTCFSSLLFAKLAHELGLPRGVLNVIVGDQYEGQNLVNHPKVSMISFTGSTEIGREINIQCAKQLKPCNLELGGKNAAVVFPDCELQEVATIVVAGAFANMGQNCCGISRLLVHESIFKDFCDLVVLNCLNLTAGDPLDEETLFGPLVNHESFRRITSRISQAKQDGISILLDGKTDQNRFVVEPTIFTSVPDEHFLAQEELFGPVLSILKSFDSVENAISRVNNTKFGLSCGIFTNNKDIFATMSSKVDAGMIWHNSYNWVPPWLPFGGLKESGSGGKELGFASMDAFSITKSICSSK